MSSQLRAAHDAATADLKRAYDARCDAIKAECDRQRLQELAAAEEKARADVNAERARTDAASAATAAAVEHAVAGVKSEHAAAAEAQRALNAAAAAEAQARHDKLLADVKASFESAQHLSSVSNRT